MPSPRTTAPGSRPGPLSPAGRAGGRRAPAAVAALAAAALVALTGCQAKDSASADPGSSGGPPAAAGTATPGPTGTTGPAPSSSHPVARSVPVRLRIPAIGVDTAVVPLGLAADGSVKVPPIAAHSPAGWYDGSPTPGQTGPSVILGHVTVGQYGDGVFLHLSRLKSGDRIVVGLKDGESAAFAVDRVQTVAKTQFPTDAVYGNVDHPALRLITCGGARAEAGGYQDNVVVYASPAS